MKREYRSQLLSLDLQSGEVPNASCSCKARKSSYCNHVLALLIEIAEDFLHQLEEVPEEMACTDIARR